MVDPKDAPKDAPKAGAERSDFQASLERLEKAVQELVGSATTEFSGRATALVDEITAKLERELRPSRRGGSYDRYGPRRDPGSDPGIREDDLAGGSVEEDLYDPSGAAERMRARRRARRRAQHQDYRRSDRTARLYRDPENGKIAGVCAGIARYYGVDNWVVRCIAVTGLLFLGQIVFPAYWIAYFVMEKPPKDGQPGGREQGGDQAAWAPELGSSLSPRRSLRSVAADMDQAELRLRRMESHVTSGQYELQRELNRIDEGNGADQGYGEAAQGPTRTDAAS
jgi:phage shock protein C